jgi:hypothetical protein
LEEMLTSALKSWAATLPAYSVSWTRGWEMLRMNRAAAMVQTAKSSRVMESCWTRARRM